MLYLIPVAALVLAAVGCSSSNEKEEKPKDANETKDAVTFPLGDAPVQEVSEKKDGISPELPDIPPVFEDVSHDIAPFKEPQAPKIKELIKLPCAFPASLTPSDKADYFITTCGGTPNSILKTPLDTKLSNGVWTKMGEVKGYPAHHIALGNGKYLVTHAAPDGVTIADENAGKIGEAFFSDLNLADSDGIKFSFVPNNPSGAVFLGGVVCVASANLDHVDMDMTKTTFFDGTVTCIPLKGTFVPENFATVTKTAGKNSTGMALVDKVKDAGGEQRFAVLSSNSYAPKTGENATLEIFSWPSMKKTAISLGEVTAQISPDIAISEGGMAYIGIQKPASALYVVNLNEGKVDSKIDLPQVKNFISSVAAYGSVAALSDFGPFGVGGQLLFVNTDPKGWKKILATPLTGAAGPAYLAGNVLHQTVTSNSGDSASIYYANLGGLK